MGEVAAAWAQSEVLRQEGARLGRIGHGEVEVIERHGIILLWFLE